MKMAFEHSGILLESLRAPRRVFIHFLDHEIFYTFGLNQRNQQRVGSELKFAFRIALLLATDTVILPASHFFESPLARLLLRQHAIFAEFGYISLASNTLDIDEFLQQKQQQYHVELDRYPLYFKATPSSIDAESSARWILKDRNSTKDITSNWAQSIGNPQIWERVYNYSRVPSASAFENNLALVPERLQSNAFIADFVVPLLPIKEDMRKATENYINILIQRAYIDSFLKTYDAACLDDFSIFDTSVILSADRRHYSVSKAKRYFLMKNILDFIMFATESQLLHYKLSEQWRSQLDVFIMHAKNHEYTMVPKQQEFIRSGLIEPRMRQIKTIENYFSGKPQKEQKRMSKVVRILFLAANPKDTLSLRLDEEVRAIDLALRQAEFRDTFDMKQHWAVRVADLQGYLLRHKPDIVHFSGHGSSSSEIILEDTNGNSHSVSHRALRAYPNNPAQRKAIKAQAKWRKAR